MPFDTFRKLLLGSVALLVLLTIVAVYAAAASDSRLSANRRLARGLLLTAALQVVVGGMVVLSRLNYLAAGFHLAMALGMLSMLAASLLLSKSRRAFSKYPIRIAETNARTVMRIVEADASALGRTHQRRKSRISSRNFAR